MTHSIGAVAMGGAGAPPVEEAAEIARLESVVAGQLAALRASELLGKRRGDPLEAPVGAKKPRREVDLEFIGGVEAILSSTALSFLDKKIIRTVMMELYQEDDFGLTTDKGGRCRILLGFSERQSFRCSALKGCRDRILRVLGVIRNGKESGVLSTCFGEIAPKLHGFLIAALEKRDPEFAAAAPVATDSSEGGVSAEASEEAVPVSKEEFAQRVEELLASHEELRADMKVLWKLVMLELYENPEGIATHIAGRGVFHPYGKKGLVRDMVRAIRDGKWRDDLTVGAKAVLPKIRKLFFSAGGQRVRPPRVTIKKVSVPVALLSKEELDREVRGLLEPVLDFADYKKELCILVVQKLCEDSTGDYSATFLLERWRRESTELFVPYSDHLIRDMVGAVRHAKTCRGLNLVGLAYAFNQIRTLVLAQQSVRKSAENLPSDTI